MSDGPDVSVACLWELAELSGATRTREGGVYRIDSEAALSSRNGVLYSSLGDDVDERITAVTEHFAARSVSFRWHVGPACRPGDLGERLLARGFTHGDTLAGMQSATDRRVVGTESAVRIEPLAAGDEEAFVDVILAGFEAPRSHRAALLTNVTNLDPRQARYVAWVADAMAGVATSARMAHAGSSRAPPSYRATAGAASTLS